MGMRAISPFYREAGSGSGIVCLHASASHSAQWRMLMDRLGHGVACIVASGGQRVLARALARVKVVELHGWAIWAR